jgi:S-ribosylhomocysteine lyase LuxS involved in autoinducer biosynthesis
MMRNSNYILKTTHWIIQSLKETVRSNNKDKCMSKKYKLRLKCEQKDALERRKIHIVHHLMNLRYLLKINKFIKIQNMN